MSSILRSTTAKPASAPEPSTDSRPFSTPGMNSFGTEPPSAVFSDTTSFPPEAGSAKILTRAKLARAAGLLLVDIVHGHGTVIFSR
jgi:hypothetical protein